MDMYIIQWTTTEAYHVELYYGSFEELMRKCLFNPAVYMVQYGQKQQFRQSIGPNFQAQLLLHILRGLHRA